jgi:hypothetical protein
MTSSTIIVEGEHLIPGVEPAWSALGRYGRANVAVIILQAVAWASLLSVLDVIEGAYNLRAPLIVRFLFLNFNYNLTHHRRPSLPWQELHKQSDHRETQPIWYRYLLVFRRPMPFPPDLSVLERRYF